MSGPKVVRIVSRREMEAIKSRSIKKFERAVAYFAAYAQGEAGLSDSQLKEVHARLEEFRNKDAAEYRSIRADVSAQITFLQKWKKELEDQRKISIVSKSQKIRHLNLSLESLRQMYRARDIALPSDLELVQALPSISVSDAELEVFELKITAAFQALKDSSARTREPVDAEYISRLKQGVSHLSFSQWLGLNATANVSSTQQRIENILAELEFTDVPADQKRAFQSRAHLLLSEKASQNLDMKIDSLVLDVSAASQAEQERQLLLAEYLVMLEELADSQVDQQEVAKLSLEAPEKANKDEIRSACAALTKLADETIADETAALKQQAMLSALESMGYHVKQNLQTAYVENGRLVVAKSHSPMYGLEVGTSKNLQRIQMRVVADEAAQTARTSKDDKAAEETWCEDFHDLREALADQGMELAVDRQFSAGEKALKTLEFEKDHWLSRGAKKEKPKNRKL